MKNSIVDGFRRKIARLSLIVSAALCFSRLMLVCSFSLVMITTASCAAEVHLLKPRLAQGYVVADFAFAKNGDIWILEMSRLSYSEGEGGGPLILAKLNAAGELTEFKNGITGTVAGRGRHRLVIAPDDSIWFSEKNMIAHFSHQGKITEFPIDKSTIDGIRNISIDVSENIWFNDSKAIGKMAFDGSMTKFQIQGAQPIELVGIAAGTDGNVWFTNVIDRIGKITPSGVTTEYSEGISTGGLEDITLGPDRCIWFIAADGEKIDKVDQRGFVTEHYVGGDVIGIAVAPNGAIWFSDSGGHHLGRVTAAGKVDELYFEPEDFFGEGRERVDFFANDFFSENLVFSPDGKLWFLDRQRTALGRIENLPKIGESFHLEFRSD